MRRYLFAVILGLAASISAAANAQLFPTDPAQQVRSLRSALNDIRIDRVSRDEGPYEYFDIVAENVCGGSVEEIARAWVNERWFSFVLERVVLVNAVVELPKGDKTVPLLVMGNTPEVRPCQSLVAVAIPQNVRVHVTIQITISSGIGERAASVGSTLVAAVTGAISALKVSPALAAGSTAIKEMGSDTKKLKSLLSSNGASLSKRISISRDVARISFVAGAREVFGLKKQPREQLLSYQPGQPFWYIPRSINEVSEVPYETIINDAVNVQPDWASSSATIQRFCMALRDGLSRALQGDPLAISLGLYAHQEYHYGDYARLKRECLYERERRDLISRGYVAPPVS
jgi:hypothetical protein